MQHLTDMLRRALGLQQQGEFAEAEKLYKRVLKIEPNHFDALHLLGLLNHQRGDNDKALELIAAALKVKPDYPDALLNYGSVLSALGRHQEALAAFDQVLAINPYSPGALNNRGNALSALRRHEEALACYDKVLELKPDDTKTLVNRGNALRDLERPDEAAASFKRALDLQPNDTSLLNNCGNTLLLLNRCDEALAYFDRALKLDPTDAETFHNRGNALLALDRHSEALSSFDRALALKPDHAKCHCDVGLAHLAMEHFNEGWKEYEWRWKTAAFLSKKREFTQPRWDGGYVKGTLLAWGEQGIGDEVIYASMVPDLTAHADAVALEVEPRLAALFARSFPDMKVISRGDRFPSSVRAQSALPSLGQYLRLSRESFPRRENGYLKADPARTAVLRRRLSPNGEIVIGLSWVSKNFIIGQLKSARLSDFAPLLQFPGCRFIDLQYGDTQAERTALKQATGLTVERLDDIDNTNDIDGVAALTAACDFVVTVSNTAAHFAGALGQKTVLLLPFGQGRLWYWFHKGESSPWYPHLRIRRQAKGQPWADLIASATGEISALIDAARQSR